MSQNCNFLQCGQDVVVEKEMRNLKVSVNREDIWVKKHHIDFSKRQSVQGMGHSTTIWAQKPCNAITDEVAKQNDSSYSIYIGCWTDG